MAKSSAAEKTAAKYTKGQLIGSKRYAKRRDLLGAILDDGQQYTIEEVETAIDRYMKGKVK